MVGTASFALGLVCAPSKDISTCVVFSDGGGGFVSALVEIERLPHIDTLYIHPYKIQRRHPFKITLSVASVQVPSEPTLWLPAAPLSSIPSPRGTTIHLWELICGWWWSMCV